MNQRLGARARVRVRDEDAQPPMREALATQHFPREAGARLATFLGAIC